MTKAKPIPSGFHTLTPHLVIKDAKQAIDFYKKAFAAEELGCMLTPDGKVLHALIKIGDSMLMIADEMAQNKSPLTLGGTPVTIHVYVDDVDTVFNRALQAGASALMPVADMFWGDRYGILTDPFGHQWSVATHVQDLDHNEIEKRKEAAMAQMSGSKC